MRFLPTPLEGVLIVEPELRQDERGAFARTWCAEEFAERGLAARLNQCSVSINPRAGTLRGMHWQAEPHGEAKLVRATAGALFDVAVDVRPGSASFGCWTGAELTAANHRALYVPRGFAHGFITLADDTEVLYLMDAPHAAGAARGFRWDDPAVGIAWPAAPVLLSPRDGALPLLADVEAR